MRERMICQQAKACGACTWLAVPYEEQLSRKRDKLVELFGPDIEIPEVIGMDEPTHYRNKMLVPFASGRGGRVLFGMYRAGTHRIVSCDGCLVNTRRAVGIVTDIARMLPACRIQPYDEDRRRGWLRHVLVREGFTSGEVMVTLVATTPEFPQAKRFVSQLRERHRDITTVVLNVNPRVTNVVLGERERNLYGRGWIVDELCGCAFKISSRSFYQTNPVQTERLYSTAISLAQVEDGTVLDAYCGVGTIGIIASRDAHCGLIGVESSAEAVSDARGNARRNKVENARFVAADAGQFAVELASEGTPVDVMFMDPPRAGASERFLAQAARLAPKRIVYISCNPRTQVRDIGLLAREGYDLRAVRAVDLFPHTPHIETVALLARRTS